jgi:hypothetical protein
VGSHFAIPQAIPLVILPAIPMTAANPLGMPPAEDVPAADVTAADVPAEDQAVF